MNEPNNLLILQIPLLDYVNSHLGRGLFCDIHGNLYHDFKYQCRPIEKHIALSIISITNNTHTCYIQYADENSPHLTTPLLWDYQAWCIQVDKWSVARERSRLERIARHILEANTKICVSKWMKMYDADIEQATTIVYSLLRKGKNKQLMAALEIEKLITTEEELR